MRKTIIIGRVFRVHTADDPVQSLKPPLPQPTMNFRLLTGLAAIICVALASCHPYNENAGKKKPVKGPEKVLTAEEQAKLKEQEAKKKAEEEKKKAEEQAKLAAGGGTVPGTDTVTPGGTTPPTNPTPPAEPKRDYAFANKVPGKEGFVFSPYNNKVVDVRDIPSGTLVADPTFPQSEKKYFRVP